MNSFDIRRLFVAATLLSIGGLFGARHADAADPKAVADRLRTEAPKAWRALKKSHTHVAGVAIFSGNSKSPATTIGWERSLEFLKTHIA